MATDEILPVSEYMRDDDGTVCVQCPHCMRILGLQSGPFLGEQFQDKECGGWLEVADDAKRVDWDMT